MTLAEKIVEKIKNTGTYKDHEVFAGRIKVRLFTPASICIFNVCRNRAFNEVDRDFIVNAAKVVQCKAIALKQAEAQAALERELDL